MQERDQECATVIGNDVLIKGEITVEKGLRVDGKVEGAVTTKGRVHVGLSGQLNAEVTAGSVLVEGKVKGNITSSDLTTLDATSSVCGDLTATRLIVTEGATLMGKLTIGLGAAKGVSDNDGVPASVASRLSGQPVPGNGRH